MGLLEREVSRCNRNFFIFNFGLTLLASLVISWSFFDYQILGKILLIMILLAFPGYNYYKLYFRLKNYQNHPLYKRLLRFGDPSKIAERVGDDLKKNILVNKDNKIITYNWIVIRSFFDFYVIHSTEICWVYLLQTKHSVNFIPTGTTYGVKLHCVSYKEIEIPCNDQEEAELLIGKIHSMSPWAIYGFSEEIKYLWGSNPQALIKNVNERIIDIQKLIKKNGKRKKK